MFLTFLFLLELLYLSFSVAENNDPVVFVHGYGGSSDHLQYGDELRSSGLVVFAADVNPYASNHERACELYAQVKGLQTDYGVCHSRENDHERFGPDYTGKGFYPEWSEEHQIHVIGHSQGGLTVRYLERMLEEGSDCAEDTFEFFTGGKRWLTSLTAMATPQEGSSVFDPDFGPFPDLQLPKQLMKMTMNRKTIKFPHSNIIQEPNENFDKYMGRIEASGLFDSKDFGIYDMSTKGVNEFNQNDASPYSDRYYFGIATERTNPTEECYFYFLVYVCDEIEVPDSLMNDYYWDTAAYIGKYAPPEDRENDGIVSNSRARCPRQENCEQVRDGSTDWYPGYWQYIDLDFVDHLQLVFKDEENDKNNFENSARRIWLELGLRIKLIPSKSLPVDIDLAFNTSEKASDVQRYLAAMKLLTTPIKEENVKNGVSGLIIVSLLVVSVTIGLGVAIYKGVKLKLNRKIKSECESINHYATTL